MGVRIVKQEIKDKISKALKGKMPKFIPDNKGLKRTEEVKKRISDTIKAKGIKPPSRKGVRIPNALIRQKGYFSFLERRRKYRKKQAGGNHTFDEWKDLKKKFNFTCPCCGKKEPKIRLTEDHIIPISKGGSDSIDNIQPLCLKCNMIKNTKTIKYNVWGNEV